MEIDKTAIDFLFRDLEICHAWDSKSRITRKLQKLGIKDFEISAGVSKTAIIFPKHGIVFKWCYQDNETIDEAAREVEIYNEAVKADLACFFPKTELYHCEGVAKKIAIQEKIDYSVSDMSLKDYHRYQKIAKTVKDDIVQKVIDDFLKVKGHYVRVLDSGWAAVAISIYGKKKVKNLCRFIQEHRINDLHCSNIGFKNKRPIILDFSGYYR